MHCRDCKILQNKAQELRQFEDGEEKWNTLEKPWKDFSPLMWKMSRGSILRMGTHNFRVRNCPSVCFPRIRASHCSKWDLMDNIYGQYILLNFTLFSSLQSPLLLGHLVTLTLHYGARVVPLQIYSTLQDQTHLKRTIIMLIFKIYRISDSRYDLECFVKPACLARKHIQPF